MGQAKKAKEGHAKVSSWSEPFLTFDDATFDAGSSNEVEYGTVVDYERVMNDHCWVASVSGGATGNWSLQGSLDNSNWYGMTSAMDTLGVVEQVSLNTPARYVRPAILIGPDGGSFTISAWLIARE